MLPDQGEAGQICVLLNASSGAEADRAVKGALGRAFARYPGLFELRVMEDGDMLADTCRRAMKDGFRTIVAAGGDGTISGVAGQLAGSGRTMGIIPRGTFNFVARGLGIPEGIDQAIDLIAKGPSRAFTLGDVNGCTFVNNASIGIYPRVLKEREGTYKRWGRSRMAAHWSVLRTFATFNSPLRMKVTVDGKVIRAKTPLAFVARSAFQLEHFGLEGADCIRDGGFALFLAPDSSRLKLLTGALRLARGGMSAERDFELICGRDIIIETLIPSHVIAMDGERNPMTGPFHFTLRKDAIQVIAPE
jgi:diacylglycerol kinase family enzyme